jgi:hypothetical protein
VLGNSCPSLLSSVEHHERAGMRTGYASFTGISSSLGDVLKNAASDQTHALKQFQAAVRQIYEETWASYYKVE